ncbi:MAG: radical SAM protein [Elusimicrobia bacterium]|nr:radical SAM protein [Elusimicrobiota bacterium]
MSSFRGETRPAAAGFPADSVSDEDYPPLDGPYQNRTYGRALSRERVEGFWRRTAALVRRGAAPPDVGLYAHWPFCPCACGYCYCDFRVPGSSREAASYLAALERELESFRGALRGLALRSVMVAGGTPTSASPGQLDALLRRARSCFEVRPDADISVEASPGTLSAGHLEVFRRHGVGRLDLGVDSLDPKVLAAAGRRGQTAAVAAAACRLVLSAGVRLDVGLLCGLPGQSAASFLKDVRWALGLRPAGLRLYRFDPRPQTDFSREGARLAPGWAAGTARCMEEADAVVTAAGYGPQAGGWRVPASVLGVGWGAKSRAFGAGWYQHPNLERRPAPGPGMPPFRGMPLTLEDEARAFVIGGLATAGRVGGEAFREMFGTDLGAYAPLSAALRSLEARGAVSFDGEGLRLLEKGRGALQRLYHPGVLKLLARSGPSAGTASQTLCRVYERCDCPHSRLVAGEEA